MLQNLTTNGMIFSKYSPVGMKPELAPESLNNTFNSCIETMESSGHHKFSLKS